MLSKFDILFSFLIHIVMILVLCFFMKCANDKVMPYIGSIFKAD